MEYEVYLMKKSEIPDFEESVKKLYLNRESYNIEHIYPKNGRVKYWKEKFKNVEDKNKDIYKHCLSNLLLIGASKNRALENKDYPTKRRNTEYELCYENGNYSERKLARDHEDWDTYAIKKRTDEISNFIQNRWEINFKKGAAKKFMGL